MLAVLCAMSRTECGLGSSIGCLCEEFKSHGGLRLGLFDIVFLGILSCDGKLLDFSRQRNQVIVENFTSGVEEMAGVELWCVVYGEASVFSVKIALDAKVIALKEAIFYKKRFEDQRKFGYCALTLFLARAEGRLLTDDADLRVLLHGEVDGKYKKMRPTWTLNGEMCFGPNFQPGHKEIHVLVELPTDEWSVKRQKMEHRISLAKLWEYSELQLKELPSTQQLAALLQKPLPFKLELLDSMVADGVFCRDGQLITCGGLMTLMSGV